MTEETQTENPSEDNSKFKRNLTLGAAALAVVIIAPIILALLLAVISTDSADTARTISIIRDVFIIIMALEAVLIIVALTVLILQITRLIVMLQNEVQPILDNTRETIETAKGTAQFVGKNVASPLIGSRAFAAGLVVFVREMIGIRRAIRPSGQSKGQVDGE